MKTLSPISLLNTVGTPKGNPNWLTLVNVGSETEPAEININGFIGTDPFTEQANDVARFQTEMAAVPRGREITVNIHSPGGNVWEALAIYDLFRSRREQVTMHIGGLAASAASFIAMAGKKVVMSATGRWMHHDAHMGVRGDAAGMKEASKFLDRESQNIATIYAEKTGRPVADIRAEMKKTTWLTGSEAKAAGFVDELTNLVPLNCAGMDLSFLPGELPEDLRNEISAGSGGSTPPPKPPPQPAPIMNRAELLQMLNALGITFEPSASDDALKALLLAHKPAASAVQVVNGKANVPANTPTPVADANVVFVDDLKSIKAQLAEERTGRVRALVQTAADECRIPGNQVDDWVADIVNAASKEAGQKILARLQSLPVNAPGVDPVNITVTADASPQAMLKHLKTLRGPINSMLRGESIEATTIKHHSMQSARAIMGKSAAYWAEVFNANTHTIDSDLKRTVILTQVMRDFKRAVMPVRAFSTVFDNQPLQGTDKVAVPYYPLFTTGSVSFVQANGYQFAADSTTNAIDVTVDQRKYQPFSFNSSEMNRQPYFNVMQLVQMQVEQLGLDVVNAVLAVVTAANFGAPVKTLAAPSFNSDTITDIGTVADLCDWPAVGRSMIIGTTYKGELLKDPSIKSALESGSDQALREGALGRLSGFNIYPYSRVPTNSENLVGMAVFPSAVLVATAPIKPAPGVMKQLVSYDVVTDPESGLAFEYRYWGDADADVDREVVECNFGFAKAQGNASFALGADGLTPTAGTGNGNALLRITSA
jgi:ATP-dependent protease ClpP protease subunit